MPTSFVSCITQNPGFLEAFGDFWIVVSLFLFRPSERPICVSFGVF